MKIARVALHHFEEPCISGTRGSGTIFFSGCNMRCLFCQNYAISRSVADGVEADADTLVKCMLRLEQMGAHNINLVSPTIWTNSLIPTLEQAKKTLKVPIVWNSNGLDRVDALRRLEGLVDVYLPDFKYSDDGLAKRYSGVERYFERAVAAVSEMRRQRSTDVFDDDGIMQKGVIVRHLVLPDAYQNTLGALRAIADIDKTMYVSLMAQYFPTPAVKDHPSLGRTLKKCEYDKAVDAFFEVGLTNGFEQELSSAVEEYTPDFDLSALEDFLSKL